MYIRYDDLVINTNMFGSIELDLDTNNINFEQMGFATKTFHFNSPERVKNAHSVICMGLARDSDYIEVR